MLAGILIDHRHRLDLLLYETLADRPTETVSSVVGAFGCYLPSGQCSDVQNANRTERFSGLDEINEALERFAPNKRYLGYS